MTKPDGWTVEELIEWLQECDPEAKVMFSYNYGDHWNSEVAQEPDEVTEEKVTWSDYHRAWKVESSDEDDGEYNTSEKHEVVIIR